MKRQWIIKRQLQETADGQKRWDQAYQLLLAETAQSPGAEGSVSPIPQTFPFLLIAPEQMFQMMWD